MHVGGFQNLLKAKGIIMYIFLSCREMIQKHGICVRALGDLTLLPEDVQRSVARVVKFSQHNTK